MFFDVDPLEAMDALHGSPAARAAVPHKDGPGCLPAMTPVEYFASNLFAARPSDHREICCRKSLATFDAGPGVRFSGERFDQNDLTVFLACLERVLAHGDEGKARFDANRMLRRLGRRVDAAGRHRLAASLWRMEAGRLELADAQLRACMRLFNTVLVDRQDGMCMVEVHAEVLRTIRTMPGLTAFIRDRLDLKGGPLTKWLLGFACVLPEDCLLDLHRLRGLSGCPEETHARFAQRVHTSLDCLTKMGYLSDTIIRPDGLLLIRRRASQGHRGTARCH